MSVPTRTRPASGARLPSGLGALSLAAFLLLFVVGLRGWAPTVGPDAHAGDPPPPPPPATLDTGAFGPVRPGSAVYPPQEIPLRFDHGRHLAKGMKCAQCHAEVQSSTSAADRNLPKAQLCDACHQSEHPAGVARAGEASCATCHVGAIGRRVTATVRMPPARLNFSHAAHVETPCETCHGDMSKVRLATVLQLPDEDTCLNCHDGKSASDDCATCHPAGPSGKLLTRAFDDMTAPRLIPRADSHWAAAAHDLNFVQDHAGVAKSNPEMCRSCHEEDSCLDCHSGVTRPMRIHAPDYLTRHGLDAKGQGSDCQSCHRLQSDCLACHERTGLGSRGSESAFGVGSGARVHPLGWTDGGNGHAFAAQRNIASCASCHEEQSCLACHATSGATGSPGLGVSPHGPGFEGSLRCQTLANRSRRACLQCHAPGTPALDCR